MYRPWTYILRQMPSTTGGGVALFFGLLLPGLSGLRGQGSTLATQPWYSTYWAYIGYVLLAVGLAYLWRASVLNQQKQLLQEKEKALRDLRAATEKQENLQQRYRMLEDGLGDVKKQLRSKTIALLKKTKENEEKGRLLQTLKEEVDEITKQHASTKFQWREVSRLLREHQETEDTNFSVLIEELHQDFLAKLNEQHPELTTYDLRLCIYLKSGLSTREMAEFMNVLPSSVNVSRSRLRKKLRLAPREDLFKFLKQLE